MNVDRVGQNYEWSLENVDTVMGTLNNFFLPLSSGLHGAFGGSSLFLIAIIVPVLSLFKMKIPRSILTIWTLLLIMFLYMQGDRTPYPPPCMGICPFLHHHSELQGEFQ